MSLHPQHLRQSGDEPPDEEAFGDEAASELPLEETAEVADQDGLAGEGALGDKPASEPEQQPSDKPSVLLAVLWVALLAVAALAPALVVWVFSNWGDLKMDEIIYTLTAPLEGTPESLYASAGAAIVPPVLVAAAVAAVLWVLLRRRAAARRALMATTTVAALALILGSSAYFFSEVGLFDYLKNQATPSSFIDENYVDPASVEISFPESKRNLVYIFLESMEITFSDISHGGAKTQDVIGELTEIGLANETFSGDAKTLNGAFALYGATYTMGGLFAQTSGLPLTITNEAIELSGAFLPQLTTVGDVLKDAGYTNVFLIGTIASFANRGTYFETHGSYEILDYTWAQETGLIPEDYSRVGFGFADSILYEAAKAELLELAAAGEPFNLTMLTVDTHNEDGFVCELCGDAFGEDQYSNVLACASSQLADFLEWMQAQNFWDNTTVVIAGDHTTVDSDYCNDVDPSFERRIYTCYVNAAATPELTSTRRYCSMDAFPTTLAALGCTIQGERLGLGTNLFSSVPTLVEEYGKDYVEAELAKRSDFFDALSDSMDQQARPSTFEYDPEDATFLVSVDADLDFEGGMDYVDYVWCRVTNDDTGETHDHAMWDVIDGAYTVSFSLEEFGYTSGTYEVDIYIHAIDDINTFYTTKSLTVEESEAVLASLARRALDGSRDSVG